MIRTLYDKLFDFVPIISFGIKAEYFVVDAAGFLLPFMQESWTAL